MKNKLAIISSEYLKQIDHHNKVFIARVSVFPGGSEKTFPTQIPEEIHLISKRTSRMIEFYYDCEVDNQYNEILCWNYTNKILPGWTLQLLNE